MNMPDRIWVVEGRRAVSGPSGGGIWFDHEWEDPKKEAPTEYLRADRAILLSELRERLESWKDHGPAHTPWRDGWNKALELAMNELCPPEKDSDE